MCRQSLQCYRRTEPGVAVYKVRLGDLPTDRQVDQHVNSAEQTSEVATGQTNYRTAMRPYGQRKF